MKKALKLAIYIVLLAYSVLSVSNFPTFASTPAILSSLIRVSDTQQITQGSEFSLITYIVEGDAVSCLGLTNDLSCATSKNGLYFDSSKFDFVSFDSDYLKYDESTQLFDKSRISADEAKYPGYKLYFTSEPSVNHPIILWEIKFRAKDNATVGETTIFNNKIMIIAKKSDTTNQQTIIANRDDNMIYAYIIFGLSVLIIAQVIVIVIMLKNKNRNLNGPRIDDNQNLTI